MTELEHPPLAAAADAEASAAARAATAAAIPMKLAAGADRVLAYRALHERGAALLAGWPVPATATSGQGTA